MIEAWADFTAELIDHKMAPHALKLAVLEYKHQDPDKPCYISLGLDFASVYVGQNQIAANRFFNAGLIAAECVKKGVLPGQVTKEDVQAHKKKIIEVWVSLCSKASKIGVPFKVQKSNLGLEFSRDKTILEMYLLAQGPDIVIRCHGPDVNCSIDLDKVAKVVSCVFHIRLASE